MKSAPTCTPSSTPKPPETLAAAREYCFRSPRQIRVIQPIDPISVTQQEFKDDCDINHILQRYQRTGAINHFNLHSPHYSDNTSCDLQTAYNIIKNAEKLYADLPSSIRELTKSPEGFLDFVQDPANAEKMRELGLSADPAPLPLRGDRGAPAPQSGGEQPPPTTKST